MKQFKAVIIILILAVVLSSCNFFRNIFGGGDKYGCPTSVNNIGAEKLSGDYKPKNREEAKAIKRAAKANKKAAKRNPYMY
ncbi:MAG TPA: hypothetical protein PLU36_02550 [Chitinophagaceae bacterium]|nr:hypothetical protein [Chitinophagaceae bacterium]MCC6634040.1 hypothetical protein [Chitinophagaceae bacterium]HMZ45662.1 hypothetical protein [Chitinophagaceae bacterium]HNE93409.1 hypothetical protein [Chitinophagaceae bacterium]HNF29223.1 hypothetical protein [Chitinophagaceae bacterium]